MAALSEEIRSVVACLSGQIDKGRVDAATAARARDILRDVADRVELIEDLIIPASVTLPDVPRPGTNVVRLDPHRPRVARPVGQPHQSPSTPRATGLRAAFQGESHEPATGHHPGRSGHPV